MGSCGEFSFKYRSMALCTSLRDSSPLVSVSFYDLSVELYTQDLVKFLRRRLFQDIFFKMAGSGLALACVADEQTKLNPGIVRLRISDQKLVPTSCVLPGFFIIASNWLLHMAVLSSAVIGRVDLVTP